MALFYPLTYPPPQFTSGVTIKEGKTVAQAVFECDAENKGWISNSTIKAGKKNRGQTTFILEATSVASPKTWLM